jgi:hypothetical protein
MFLATGPGRVDIDADFSGVGILHALLYNFDRDDFADLKYRDLKPEHQRFLTEKAVPLLGDDRGNIWMQGSASRIGSNAWNKELSQTRVGRVANFLQLKGIDSEQMQLDAVGEELADAAGHSQDDMRDRSVKIWVMPKLHFEPAPPPPKVPPRPKVTRHFKIAMVANLSVTQALNIEKVFQKPISEIGGGPAIESGLFMVWDTRNKIVCFYVYIGLGLGAGLKMAPKASATTHGPWNDFTTEKPIACWQFGRCSRFTTMGVASKSLNWITIETPPGVNNVDSLQINTGTTLGLGASTTVGDFILVDKPRLYNGP